MQFSMKAVSPIWQQIVQLLLIFLTFTHAQQVDRILNDEKFPPQGTFIPIEESIILERPFSIKWNPVIRNSKVDLALLNPSSGSEEMYVMHIIAGEYL